MELPQNIQTSSVVRGRDISLISQNHELVLELCVHMALIWNVGNQQEEYQVH